MSSTAIRKTTKKAARSRASRVSLPAERYTPKRLAQFLLENATNAADYAAARREVRTLGLDPDKIPHDPPAHV